MITLSGFYCTIRVLFSPGITANRSKLIAWYVSDCNSLESHREDYASFLANYVPVDIYGPCGNMVRYQTKYRQPLLFEGIASHKCPANTKSVNDTALAFIVWIHAKTTINAEGVNHE